MWCLDQVEPGNPVYHIACSMRLSGDLNLAALEQALAAVIRRHEALRTSFFADDGTPMQCIHAELSVPVRVEALPGDVADARTQLNRRIADIARQPFDLANGPLIRVHVLRVAQTEDVSDHILMLVIHHVIADGWSMSVLFRELATAYEAYCLDSSCLDVERDWPALPVQYADYAMWQRSWLSGDELERQVGYWRDRLADAPPLLMLPTDRPRPVTQTHRGGRTACRISAHTLARLHELGRDESCTLFMVLLAAFDAVLARYAGQTDIVVGTPIAGRSRTELEGLIGFFVNTLVLRTDLSGNPSFRELLARVKHAALDAYAHQDVPFEKLVEVVQPPRSRSYNPLVQVMLTVHNQPVPTFELAGIEVEPMGIDNAVAKFDLNLHVAESDDRLMLAFAYNTDLFDAETIAGLGAYYETVLSAVVSEPGLRLSELPTLGSAQVSAAPREPVVAGPDLVSGFAARVAAAPKHLAVQTPTWSLSYGALNARSNRVAHALQALSLQASEGYAPRVGLMVAQDAPGVIGMLGILKSGAAYVPLDPALPDTRLRTMAADAGLTAVVADGAHAAAAATLFAADEATLPVIDCEAAALASYADTDPATRPAASALAYIIYTSGTTGQPKGVMQTHGGAVTQVQRYAASLDLGAADRLSLLSGYGFDAAVQDIFGALLSGASLYPFDVRNALSPGALVDALSAARITIVHATPTVYRHLFGSELNCSQDLTGIRRVVLGGEPVRRSDFELYRSRFARSARLVNGLGLTESTMGLQYVADHDTRLLGQGVPVGDAVAGLEVLLVDEQGLPGWYGEIRLRGAGITPGYWGGASVAVTAPVRSDGWYRTGDLGRRQPDGQIVYLGRLDEQVKIRGQRAELGEIEAVLGGLAGIGECAVRLIERPGDVLLVAYVVPGEGLLAEADELRRVLGRSLPAYMVPQAIEVLDILPRRANGKVAKELLPAPGLRRDTERASVPPRTELEAVLGELWCAVLGVETLGVHDDFFALGGHSLLATRLIARVRDRLGVEVPLVNLFEYPTVAGLADTLESGAVAADSGIMLPATARAERVLRLRPAGAE